MDDSQNPQLSGGSSRWRESNDGYFTPKNIINPQFIRSSEETRKPYPNNSFDDTDRQLEEEARKSYQNYLKRQQTNGVNHHHQQQHEQHFDFQTANSQLVSPKTEHQLEYADLVPQKKIKSPKVSTSRGIFSDLEPIDLTLIAAFCLLSLFGIIGLLYLHL